MYYKKKTKRRSHKRVAKRTYKKRHQYKKKKYSKRSGRTIARSSIGGALVKKRFRRGPARANKALTKGFAPQTLILNNVTSASASPGYQNFAQILFGEVLWPSAGSYTGDLGYVVQAAGQNLHTSATGSGSATTNLISERVYIKSTVQEVTYTNSNLHTMFMTLYDIRLLSDIAGQDSAMSPVNVMSSSYQTDAAANLSGFTFNISQVGWEPSMCSLFNKTYKIIGRKDVILAPGETHIHRLTVTYNKIFDLSKFLVAENGIVVPGAGVEYFPKTFFGAVVARFRFGPVAGSGGGYNYGSGTLTTTQTSKWYFSSAPTLVLPQHMGTNLAAAITGNQQYVVPDTIGIIKEGTGVVAGLGST